MNPLIKRIVNTGILTLILAITGIILSRSYPLLFDRESITIMLVSMFLMSVLIHILIHAGENRETDVQTMLSLAAIGAKFILSALLALVYFKVFKKYGMNNILLFFVVYLCFTVYTVIVTVKALNIRSLKEDQN